MSDGCVLCPRRCGADRAGGQRGRCGAPSDVLVARAALHFWEEPCISGQNGTGAVFFAGCPLQCVYCQNREISFGLKGKVVTVDGLRRIYRRLIDRGAETIDLVTPTHYAEAVAESLTPRLPVPVVYNTSGYERVETLRLFDGLVDVYLPDFKYADAALAARYSHAPDYPSVVEKALAEMFRQTGGQVFDKTGRLLRGVQVRHLVLPDALENTYSVIDRFTELFPRGEVGFSLMSQYTPTEACAPYPSLCRRLTQEEYHRAADYLYLCGVTNGFMQELSSAKTEYVPPFDLTGVEDTDTL